MYSGLSLAYRETGHVDAAVKYAGRSIALLEVLRDRVSLAKAENNLGLILMAQGDRAAAAKHLDRSLELAEETDLEIGRSHVLMSLCELSLVQGNVQAARQFAEQALDMAERMKERRQRRRGSRLAGQDRGEVGDDELAPTPSSRSPSELTELESGRRALAAVPRRLRGDPREARPAPAGVRAHEEGLLGEPAGPAPAGTTTSEEQATTGVAAWIGVRLLT